MTDGDREHRVRAIGHPSLVIGGGELPRGFDAEDRLDRGERAIDAAGKLALVAGLIDVWRAADRGGLVVRPRPDRIWFRSQRRHGIPNHMLLVQTHGRPTADREDSAIGEDAIVEDAAVGDAIGVSKSRSALLTRLINSAIQADPAIMPGGRRGGMLRGCLSDQDRSLSDWSAALEGFGGDLVPPNVTMSSPASANRIDGTAVADVPAVNDVPAGDDDSTQEIFATAEISTAAVGGDRTTEVGTVEVEAHDVAPEPATPFDSDVVPERIGGYRIETMLGRGGMGAVYRGVDPMSDEPVAIKILSVTGAARTQAVRRFEKEARLLADVANPHVTRLIDVGVHGNDHYLVMEFVDGITLKSWMADHTPVNETDGLRIAADLATALVDAHRRGIVHRDIKPDNVLLRYDGDATDRQSWSREAYGQFTLKLTDFGIARHVRQTESLAVTRAGSIMGTPRYMSPEQCRGSGDIGPAADVYAIGVTVYELLTGSPPFDADDPMKLAAQHCFDSPPPIDRAVAISDAAATLVHRLLAKKPESRLASAAAVVEEIAAITANDDAAPAASPAVPSHDGNAIFDKTRTWEMDSDAADLWPLVSDTQRLNKAVGLPSVEYETVPRTEDHPSDSRRVDSGTPSSGGGDRSNGGNRSNLGVRRFGSFKLAGVAVRWEEHPFQWIEGTRLGVLREFDGGPMKWFASEVELQPRPGGGCRLSHRVRIEPRGWIGWALAKIEAEYKGFRNLDRVYRNLDAAVATRKRGNDPGRCVDDVFSRRRPKRSNSNTDRSKADGNSSGDAHGNLSGDADGDRSNQVTHTSRESKSLTSRGRKRLQTRLDELSKRDVASDAASVIAMLLRRGDDQQLDRLRPYELADRFGGTSLRVDRSSLLTAMLHAADVGLLTMHFDVICPTCRVASARTDSLGDVRSHTHCAACNVDYVSNLGDCIELIFRSHPEIRSGEDAMYCVGGPEHAPHVVAQIRVEANEQTALTLDLSDGDYLLRAAGSPMAIPMKVGGATPLRHHRVELASIRPDHVITLASGRQHLQIIGDRVWRMFRVERAADRGDAVTATQLAANATFAELFPNQSLDVDHPVQSQNLTVLMIEAVGRGDVSMDHWYHSDGDIGVYHRLRSAVDDVVVTIAAGGGSIYRRTGGTLAATFTRRDAAVSVAKSLAVRSPNLDPSNASEISNAPDISIVEADVRWRGVVHAGSMLLAGSSSRESRGVGSALEPFGREVRYAEAILTAVDSIVVTAETADDPIVTRQLAEIVPPPAPVQLSINAASVAVMKL